MSGGSYDYLCHSWDLEDIIGKRASLASMNDRLATIPGAEAALAESIRLDVLLTRWETEARVRLNLLRDVWKAVEWWDSCDWGEDSVREALDAFAEGREKAAHHVEP